MFLLLFLILTIVSEYIARILDETKDQPLYFVESETNSAISSTNKERLNVVHEKPVRLKSEAAAG
jgi:dolichol-phosphate mannosyltransferase